jgi:RNA polymerase sigma-70 factor (ECF subfamily)
MKTKYDPTDWITHMTRIRDAQDQAAFAELFQYFAPRVKAFLMRSGADATLAEECTQEVMATLWQKAHLFDASRASVATWVFTIARNRKIDALRKQRRPSRKTWYGAPKKNLIRLMSLVCNRKANNWGAHWPPCPRNKEN